MVLLTLWSKGSHSVINKISGVLVPLTSHLFNFTAGIQTGFGLSVLAKHTHSGTFYRESWGGFR